MSNSIHTSLCLSNIKITPTKGKPAGATRVTQIKHQVTIKLYQVQPVAATLLTGLVCNVYAASLE